jgi:hypothetical protein
MSFPSPLITPPTFTQWPSAAFNNLVFGPAPFYLRADGNFDGIFMPTVRNSDPAAPRTHGAYIGLDLLGERDITLTIDIGPPFGSYSTLAGAQAALRSALTPSYTTENPLFLQVSSGGTMYASMVRPQKRSSTVDLAYIVGNLAQKVPIQFRATDPTMYAAGTLAPTAGVPAPLSGISFLPSGLTFNMSFGGGTQYGSITATNYGDMTCYPLIVFTGPCTYPKLTNASLSGSPFMQYAVSMAANDNLFIQTDPRYPSAVYYAAGSSSGTNVDYSLVQGSSPWGLASGVNNLQFTTLDVTTVAGYVTVEYTSAYSAAA